MNKEWSEQNKRFQSLIKKKDTFKEGAAALSGLRDDLMRTVLSFRDELSAEDFCAMPFAGAEGYHSKTVAYSLWHIFRIEDIVAHTLVDGSEQVFFAGGWQEKTRSPIVTTGNELSGQEIADFSAALDIGALYEYIAAVKESTERIAAALPYERLKEKVSAEARERLEALNVVSREESAVWLIDYWCGKDIRGLMQMPFSRHWIMHIEACLRIISRLHKK